VLNEHEHENAAVPPLHALQLLHHLTEQLTAAADLHTAMHATLAAMMKLCRADRGVVHVLNADGTLQLAAAKGFEHIALNSLEASLARCESTALRASQELKPATIGDFSRTNSPEATLASKLHYVAAWSVPLIESESLSAVFTVYFNAARESTTAELAWLDAFARQASFVLKQTQAHSALAASEQRFRSIFQESNDFIVTADLNQKITYCNPATAIALGWPVESIIGKSIADFIPAPHFDRTSTMLSQKLREGGATRYEVDVLARDGRRMTWEINSRLTFGPDGRPTGLHAIGRDVTTMRAAHEALRTRERALREADQRKDEFLAMLAHELRNPLAPIRTAAHVLKQTRDANHVRTASDIVERQVDHITRIVDDLLDVSRVTRGLVTLNRQRIALDEVITTAVEQVRPLIESRQHRLQVTLPDEQVTLYAEAARLVQIVANLLSNSARHSGTQGDIELFVTAHTQIVEIHVRDHGVGIDPELLPRVFDLFTQADRSAARSEGGLGIGLALVRRLAELHGGHVEAQSSGLGHGAQFTVVLPRLAEDNQATPLADAPQVKPESRALRILIVDDNEDAANMLAMLLQLAGHDVAVEYAPHAAIERAREVRPDVALLDIGLPQMNGYELAARLRSQDENAAITLVAISGYGQEEDRRASKEAGFVAHLMKPVSALELELVLSQLQSESL